MTEGHRVPLAKALAILGDTFNEPVSDLRAEGYFAALHDLDWEVVQQAVRTWLRVGARFPLPRDLRQLVEGAPEDQADLAWGRVIRAIHDVGGYRTPALDAPTLAAIRDVWGSWTDLCATLPAEGPELVGWVKQFKATYATRARRADVEAAQGALPAGVAEMVRALAAGKGMPA